MKFPAFPTAKKVLFPWEAPNSPIRVPDLIFDHDFPFNELRITPLKPNSNNVSSAYMTSLISIDVRDFLLVHFVPSEEVMIVPL